jgi:type VI secretion system secreted protein VgrG
LSGKDFHHIIPGGNPQGSLKMTVNDWAAVLGAGLDQSRRLLKLDTALGGNVLVPVRVVGTSRIGRNYDFTVDVASLKDSIELKSLIAKPVTLWTQQTDSSYVPRHGYVHTARFLGSDGSVQLYQLSFSSWLHFLKFRSDARIFQDKTAEDIIAVNGGRNPTLDGGVAQPCDAMAVQPTTLDRVRHSFRCAGGSP